MIDKAMITDMINTNPLSLLAIKDKQVIDEINNLVPYSTAFEIECNKDENYNEDNFTAIPNIISVTNDNWEQRYRIPNGLKGIICLYHISVQLKLNSLLNPLSSIHYHVDCTGYWEKLYLIINTKENSEYILSELDTWLEGDIASNRSYGSWYRMNLLQTMEFRLGEMTFDYKVLLKRIIHCNKIVRRFKLEIEDYKEPTFDSLDITPILQYNKLLRFSDDKRSILNTELLKLQASLNKKEIPIIVEEIPKVINRVHRIN